MDHSDVGGDDLAARGADLQAEVEIVTVQKLPEALVEADAAHDPRRQAHGHQRVEHRAPAGAENVAGDAVELDAGVFQRPVQPVGLIEHLTASPAGALETDESDGRALSNSPGSRGRPPHQTSDGHTGTKKKTASTSDPPIITHFTRPRTPNGQRN
jgi:hypothetical protein